eukprot:1160824-Pelagomonas_calceolata.AAC.9
MQSGLHRGCYGRPHPNPTDIPNSLVPPGQKPIVSAHMGPVVGVAVDSCNRLMVSCGLDKVLRIWDFKAMKVRRVFKAFNKGPWADMSRAGEKQGCQSVQNWKD